MSPPSLRPLLARFWVGAALDCPSISWAVLGNSYVIEFAAWPAVGFSFYWNFKSLCFFRILLVSVEAAVPAGILVGLRAPAFGVGCDGWVLGEEGWALGRRATPGPSRVHQPLEVFPFKLGRQAGEPVVPLWAGCGESGPSLWGIWGR